MMKEMSMISNSECLARYCNGPRMCTELVENTTDQYMCDAEWCSFHPKYNKEDWND